MNKEKRKIVSKIKSNTGCSLVIASHSYDKYKNDFKLACEYAVKSQIEKDDREKEEYENIKLELIEKAKKKDATEEEIKELKEYIK